MGRHKAHVTSVMLPGYKCCSGHIHNDLKLEHDSHLPCIHGMSGVFDMREEPCDCDDEEDIRGSVH